ncbi:MAG: hypothetical protein H0U74_04105 [Bradymonadaceae bacterium]|nr:hypothetical protein [Lujinxingiaceae bacterium]
MRYFLSLLLCLFVVSLASVGCDDDPSPTKIPPVVSNNSNNAEGDTSDVVVVAPDTSTDVGQDTVDPGAPGFMNGTWEVRSKSGDTLIATLALLHKSGESTVSGTFQMEDVENGDSGALDQGTWIENTFGISWFVRVNNRSERLAVSAAEKIEDDPNSLAKARFSDERNLSVGDVRVLRKPE